MDEITQKRVPVDTYVNSEGRVCTDINVNAALIDLYNQRALYPFDIEAAIVAPYVSRVIGSGGGVSGAMIEGHPFSTTVSGYTMIFDGSRFVASNASHSLVLSAGGVTADGSAITQVSSAFAGTSLGIAELSGGVKYVCSSALSALSIGSAAEGCNATIFFTVASGAIVTPPSNVPYFGVTEYAAGSRYVMAINGDMVVVVEAATGA